MTETQAREKSGSKQVEPSEGGEAESPWWKSSAPPRPGARTIFVATASSVLALVVLAIVTIASGEPLLIPPMAASMALVVGAPKLPLAQPRNVIGGQLVSALVGVLFGLAGDSLWLAAIAGGVALGAMMIARMPHSPAAATAIIGVTTGIPGWEFVALAGCAALVLVLIGLAGNRLNKVDYPTYVW